MEILGLTIQHVPAEVKEHAEKWLALTKKLEADFNSGVAIDAAALIDTFFPGIGTEIRTECIEIIQLAEKALTALAAIGDNAGIAGRLKRLADDLTTLSSSGKHGLEAIIAYVQIVYEDLFGK